MGPGPAAIDFRPGGSEAGLDLLLGSVRSQGSLLRVVGDPGAGVQLAGGQGYIPSSLAPLPGVCQN